MQIRQEVGRLTRIFGLCCALSACATSPRIKVVGEVVDPERARSRSVSVLSDSFMNDPVEADNLAQLVRDQLSSHGFSVSDSEENAELIVIPSIERSAPAEAPTAGRRMLRPFDIPYGPGQTSLMGSQNAMRNLGFEVGTLSVQEQPRIGLIVTAISKNVWLNAPLASEGEIPRVWRVVAIAPLTKEDMTTKLVEAAGAKLGEIAEAPSTPAPPTPTPSPTPKKKP
jgi:hypothetical protein